MEFKDIPNAVLVLIMTVIILVVGALITTLMSTSGILPVFDYTNETLTAGANGTGTNGFRIYMPFDNLREVSSVTLANLSGTDDRLGGVMNSANYTLDLAQGYINVDGSLFNVDMWAGQAMNVTGNYYNDTITDYGMAAFATFGSWLSIIVIILLATVIFGLFKYFGSGGEGAAY